MQADSDDSSDVVAKFSTKLSSLFTQKPLWTLCSFSKTLFSSEFIYPRESRRRKWKSWRWMRRPTAYFENTVCASKIVLYANLGLSQIRFSLCPLVNRNISYKRKTNEMFTCILLHNLLLM